jgi:hypothetical protein
MNRILLALLIFAAYPALAVDRITASLSFTNSAGTTNGQTITVNGNTRTWTNSVFLASSQVLTNSTASGAKTNLYNAVGLAPFSQVTLINQGSTNFDLVANSGVALTVTLSAGYASVTYSTQSVTTMTGVRVPISGEPVGGIQTNIASLLVKGENDLSTNKFYENAIAVQNLLGLTNAQTVAGIKQFTNVAGQWKGIISNSPAISGNIDTLTNGRLRTPILISPTLTNGINYGNAFSSPGSGANSEQYGISALASGAQSFAAGYFAQAAGANAAAIGTANAGGDNSTAVGVSANVPSTSPGGTALGNTAVVGSTHTNSTAIGANSLTTAKSQIMVGTQNEYVHFPGNTKFAGNTELRWARFPITSLATGNNAAVAVGTNTFVEVSGPGAAFTINGIAGGSDGKFLIILNQTGFNMSIAHESGTDPTAANRITSMTGADRATTGNGSAQFIYSGAASRWILLGVDP